jgi:glycosyltransferase involved in cell wall biosynthesis
MHGVSVIICCYNSINRLPETLRCLASQRVSNEVAWEVVVIDNNSIDDTAKVAQQLWSQYGGPTSFQVIEEKQAGLSFARKKGFENAKYEYCLFCDDDNWLAADYVATAYELMKADRDIGVVGGLGEAVCEVKPPKWFETNKGSFAVGPQAERDGDITNSRGFVYGAGAIFRKSVYVKITHEGFKGFLTGRKDEKITAGDDSELCYNYVLQGYKIYYSTRLKFKHFMPASRLTDSYQQKLNNGFKQARVVLVLYRYKLFQEYMLYKNFLWLREITNAIYREFEVSRHFSFKNTFAYALLTHRKTFIHTQKRLRNYNKL